jgi:hypothetical protein
MLPATQRLPRAVSFFGLKRLFWRAKTRPANYLSRQGRLGSIPEIRETRTYGGSSFESGRNGFIVRAVGAAFEEILTLLLKVARQMRDMTPPPRVREQLDQIEARIAKMKERSKSTI